MTYETSVGANMFAYCMNNPVCNYDLNGCSSVLILGLMVVSIMVLCTSSESQIPVSEREAKEKYNTDTVCVYWNGGDYVDGKVNAQFYVANTEKKYINVNVSPSLEIRNKYEMNAVLDVIIDSPYYSFDRFGSKSFMRAQWIAHNWCYDLAVSGEFGYKIAQKISGAENPIESSRVLDIRNLGNMGIRSYYLYRLIEGVG